MQVNEHERLSNHTFRYELKAKEQHVFAATSKLKKCVHARKSVCLWFFFRFFVGFCLFVCLFFASFFFTIYCYIISDKPKKQRQRNKLPTLHKIEHCKYYNSFVSKGLRSTSPPLQRGGDKSWCMACEDRRGDQSLSLTDEDRGR